MSRAGWLAVFVLARALVGQVTSNSVTVTATASPTATLQPDQAILNVSVNSGIDKSLDDIVAALPGTGITAANFTRVGSTPSVQPLQPANTQSQLQWNFQLPVAIAKLKDTTTALAAPGRFRCSRT